jgi:serine/threonine-protein kinase
MGRSNPSEPRDERVSAEAETALPDPGTQPSAGVSPRSSQIGTAETLPPPAPDGAAERYSLVRELGRGGMGRVDEVFDATLGRTVARKAALVAASHGRAKMLVAEAQTCAQLEHPSIVPVYDAGVDGEGQPWYTMRNVRGRTLGDVLLDKQDPTREPKTLAQLLAILRQVCLAVDYAHSRGVVHRDLKPDNVIVGEFGEVYVLDWGIAHVMGGSDVRRAALGDYVAGSPGYVAPEQAMGRSVDARADVFALGAMLHELLTGETPFPDADFHSVRARATARLSMPPSRRNPTVHPSFDALVASCLEPNPEHRLSSARLIADAIDVYLDAERERAERERDALQYTAEGRAAHDAHTALDRESRRLEREAQRELDLIPVWETATAKSESWAKATKARHLAAEAAHALARAEAAFSRALARVEGYPAARRGLAALYLRQFEEAEARGEHDRMVQYLDLARSYDDGELRLLLEDVGELVVESSPGTRLSVARIDLRGALAQREAELPIEANTAVALASGSYVVLARAAGVELRYPLRVARAMRHRLRLRHRAPPAPGLVVIPGGPFRDATGSERWLPDFALGRFPVTIGEYVRFLDTLSDEERAARVPRASTSETPGIVRGPTGWSLAPGEIEGPGLERVRGREMELPVGDVSWFDATAYMRWLARETGMPFRLPRNDEWEKAARGADGRRFPMGNRIDPSFAKLRESRPEASQPEPVGAFPLDESPYGVRDLVGGIGDWTSTMADGGEAPTTIDEEGHAAEREAVWRGCSWSQTATFTGDMRYTQMLRHRVGWVGFRVALTLEGPSSELVVEPMT